MFCVGAKIAFSDGRQAVARTPEEMQKIFDMGEVITGMVCNADSISLIVQMAENGVAIGYRNLDLKEADAVKVEDMEAAKPVALYFMETGLPSPELTWQNVDWVRL